MGKSYSYLPTYEAMAKVVGYCGWFAIAGVGYWNGALGWREVFVVCLVGFVVEGWGASYTSETCCTDSSTNDNVLIEILCGSAKDPELLIKFANHHHH